MSGRGGRGGRGGAPAGRGRGFKPGVVSIGGVDLKWDLTGVKIDKAPAERFPVGTFPLSFCVLSGWCDSRVAREQPHMLAFTLSRSFRSTSFSVSFLCPRCARSLSFARNALYTTTMLSSRASRTVFPPRPPPQAPPPTEYEKSRYQWHKEILERRRNGPLFTILNDGMKSGLKRRDNEKPPTEAQLFNPFTDNLTYSAKYHKEKRKLPRFDQIRINKNLFPRELWGVIGATEDDDDAQPTKKRKVGPIAKDSSLARIEKALEKQEKQAKKMKQERDDDAEDFDEEDDEEDKQDGVNDEDNWSGASSDSEESNDDYNAERYFDNGDDDDGDDGDGYENTYE
ncbi:hypothetical protein K491DRAFT_480636 [Lophiostoma macrostomum CBS 122681]|uniref:DNA-directed RNA polymerase III subunit n=1 Tax=Lophiostoma macrostomum CBS 122681 TaxID=1314788 RepID=A0A6A6TNZ1_9PLEO|nr:hypothetical protein K491DRAFT_480636 [Lophiostoma macrostomum CBS 122681]